MCLLNGTNVFCDGATDCSQCLFNFPDELQDCVDDLLLDVSDCKEV